MTVQDVATITEAVQLAMNAESEASAFYRKAAEATRDPRGREMFTQLAAFEQKHYENLKRLLDTPASEDFAGYEGTAFAPEKSSAQAAALSQDEIKTDVDAVNLAIKAEKEAHRAYLDLAEKSTTPAVKDMFRKLAEEEDLHRRMLEDQFYALVNKGYWTWGE